MGVDVSYYAVDWSLVLAAVDGSGVLKLDDNQFSPSWTAEGRGSLELFSKGLEPVFAEADAKDELRVRARQFSGGAASVHECLAQAYGAMRLGLPDDDRERYDKFLTPLLQWCDGLPNATPHVGYNDLHPTRFAYVSEAIALSPSTCKRLVEAREGTSFSTMVTSLMLNLPNIDAATFGKARRALSELQQPSFFGMMDHIEELLLEWRRAVIHASVRGWGILGVYC